MHSEIPHPFLSKETLLEAFSALNQQLAKEDVIGEICIFGGTVMVLAFNARLSTKDVDAIFKPPEVFRRNAALLAESMQLPKDWLNDGVKGFVSDKAEHTEEGLPKMSNLRMLRPRADYLLAMKCMAARSAAYDTKGDRDDIVFLIQHLGLNTADEVCKIVEKFYPPERILPKTQFMIQEVIASLPTPPAEPKEQITHLSADDHSTSGQPQKPDGYEL